MGKRASFDNEMWGDNCAWAWAFGVVEALCGFQSQKCQEAVDEPNIDSQVFSPIVLDSVFVPVFRTAL